MPNDSLSDGQSANERKESDAVLLAAMELAATVGWRETNFQALSARTGLSLAQLRQLFPTRLHLLAGLDRQADEAVLAQPALDPTDGPHDRLFDVLMRRFDALDPFRPGLRALDQRGETVLASPFLASGLIRSMGWMLESAGLARGGMAGVLQRRGLAVVWLATARVWLKDETADKAATMAALDRNLKRAHQLWNSIPSSFTGNIGSK
jgi:AcrR family transcriptional regulator